MTEYRITTKDHETHTVQATCPLSAISILCCRTGCYSTDIIILQAKQEKHPTNPTNQKV